MRNFLCCELSLQILKIRIFSVEALCLNFYVHLKHLHSGMKLRLPRFLNVPDRSSVFGCVIKTLVQPQTCVTIFYYRKNDVDGFLSVVLVDNLGEKCCQVDQSL